MSSISWVLSHLLKLWNREVLNWIIFSVILSLLGMVREPLYGFIYVLFCLQPSKKKKFSVEYCFEHPCKRFTRWSSPFAIFGEFWVENDGVQSTDQFISVQSLSCIWLFATPWTAARQAPLSITNSWSSLKPMFITWHLFSFSYVECNIK